MIKFYVAPPGTGKTLVLVQREVVHALKTGKKVCHNIRGLNVVKLAYYCGLFPEDVEKQLEYMYSPCIERFVEVNGLQEEAAKIGIDKIEEKYAKELTPVFKDAVPDILEHIATLSKNYLIVLDEAQIFIPATDFKEPKNIKFFEYATVHRHLGHDLVLATQHEDNVDVKLRRIANLLIYMYRRDILGFLFRNTLTERHYAGCATGNPELLNKYVTKYDKRVFGLYKSYVAGDIVEVRKFRSIWRNGFLFFLVAVFLVSCVFFVPKFLRQWGVVGKTQSVKPVSAPVEKMPSPYDYLGEHEEYYCGNKLYVLRSSGNVEVWVMDGVPLSVCPSKNFHFKKGGFK